MVVIDVVLLGIVHPRIERLAGDGDAVVVTVQLGGARHLVSVRMDPSDPDVSSS